MTTKNNKKDTNIKERDLLKKYEQPKAKKDFKIKKFKKQYRGVRKAKGLIYSLLWLLKHIWDII